MIPTRNQIEEQIKKIQTEQPFVDVRKAIREWVVDLEMPEMVIIAGEEVSPKQKILSDLDSYTYA